MLAYQSLATLMNLEGDPASEAVRRHIDAHTLIRKVDLFDPADIRWNREVSLKAPGGPMAFRVRARQMPDRLPEGWQATPAGEGEFKVVVDEQFKALLPDRRVSKVSSAAQLPTGFDPGAIYASRSHPAGPATGHFRRFRCVALIRPRTRPAQGKGWRPTNSRCTPAAPSANWTPTATGA